jgi:hypothetical protein
MLDLERENLCQVEGEHLGSFFERRRENDWWENTKARAATSAEVEMRPSRRSRMRRTVVELGVAAQFQEINQMCDGLLIGAEGEASQNPRWAGLASQGWFAGTPCVNACLITWLLAQSRQGHARIQPAPPYRVRNRYTHKGIK